MMGTKDLYMSKSYVAIWKKTGATVLIHRNFLFSEVEFDGRVCFLQAELGPSSDFEIVCEL